MMPAISQSIHRLILEALPFGVYLVNSDGKITVWSDGAERLTGYLRQEVLGRLGEAQLVDAAEVDGLPPNPSDFASSEAKQLGFATARQLSLHCRDGHFLTVNFMSAILRDELGKRLGTVRVFEPTRSPDLHNRRQDRLGAYGCLDSVTGVLNHSLIQARLKESLTLYALYPIPFSVLCYTIDDLAKLSARYGQAAVDAALRMVASAMENSLRPTDFLGRWTSEEFLAILPECGEGEILKVAERLRKKVRAATVSWWGDTLHATVSIGSTVVHDNDSVSSLLSRAEEALRESSKAGGDRVVMIGASGIERFEV